ncbi:MAG: serine hydrolase [Verrucomicrobiota bacterium]
MLHSEAFRIPGAIAFLIIQSARLGAYGNDQTKQQSANGSRTPFQDAVDALTRGDYPAQHALLIFQADALALEQYWDGPDLVYGEKKNRIFGPDSLHGTRSCSKSVFGLVADIAVDEGLLPEVGTPAHKLFPDLKLHQQPTFTEAHRAITLEHLLDMKVGMDWQQHQSPDHPNNEAELEQATNGAAYVWSQPMKSTPGKRFNYHSGATALLARAITRATGGDFEKYTAEKLFTPLGIKKWEWLRDNDREVGAHFGLRLRPRDMVKIGRLVLQDGKWDGQQIVPRSWIEAMSDHRNRTRKYRYQWWLKSFELGEQKAESIVAYGKGGQTIYVLPDQEAIVVLTAGHYDNHEAAGKRDSFLQEVILPELLRARHPAAGQTP